MPKITSAILVETLNYALLVAQEQFEGKPYSLAICDERGDLLTFFRKTPVKLLTIELTERKAYTSARLGCTTQGFLARLQRESLEICYFADPKLTALPGGVPLVDQKGECIGAVAIGGISVQGDHDFADIISKFIMKKIGD